jgi:hypothetical protein
MSTPGPESIFSPGATDSQKDRREYPRVHVHWYCNLESPVQLQRVRVLEISEVGFGFVCDVSLPIGTVIKFRLSIPDPATGVQWHDAPGQAQVASSVLSRAGFRAGVSVQSMLSSHQEMLRTWVKSRLR